MTLPKPTSPTSSLQPVKVQTFFSRGEFKLFKYLFHLGEWRRVAKPEQAEYLHFPRERDCNWALAKNALVSTIPGAETFCKKREHTWFANKMKELHPDLNWYYPETFILPQDFEEYSNLHNQNKEDVYIAKMSGSRQGVGVRVISRPAELALLFGPQAKGFTTAVVQKYVKDPLLLNGFKNDLRLYLMITSVDPPIAYLNSEGLARFCTEQYVAPTPQNTAKLDPSSQLTNFSLNKGNKNFQHCEELFAAHSGTKRTLASYWQSVETETPLKRDTIWPRIEGLVKRVVKTMLPSLRLAVEGISSKGGEPGTKYRMMHILGLDVILDEEGNPWLLELNSMPSMAIEGNEHTEGGEENQIGEPDVAKVRDEVKPAPSKSGKPPQNAAQKRVAGKRPESQSKKQRSKTTALKVGEEKPVGEAPQKAKSNLVDVYVKSQ